MYFIIFIVSNFYFLSNSYIFQEQSSLRSVFFFISLKKLLLRHVTFLENYFNAFMYRIFYICMYTFIKQNGALTLNASVYINP